MEAKPKLLKYKIGLAILSVLTIGLVVFVASQASATKQDTKTYNRASDISNTLNTYVDDNEVVPSSLAAAGIKNAPTAISYQKLSALSYKFCVTYKASSSGFDVTGAVLDLTAGGADDFSDNSSGADGELYIGSTYHKGTNCVTVKTAASATLDSGLCAGTDAANTCQADDGSSPITAPDEQSTGTPTLCGYGATSSSGCSMRCTQSTEAVTLSTTDDTISTVKTGGENTVLDVTDTKGTKHTVTVNSNTKLYDGSCDSIAASDLLQGDTIRVIVIGQNGQTVKAVQGSQVEADEIDDFSA